MRRTFLGAIRLLGGLGAGFAIFMLVVAWRLSSGPISLSWATPYVENALNSAHPNFHFRFDDTILTWAGWQRTFDVRVLNVRVVGDNDTALAAVPEISLSISARALLHGKIAPKSIEMFGPKLRLERQSDGNWEIGLGTDAPRSGDFASRIVNQLMAAPDPNRAMSYLSRVVVIGADLTLTDRRLDRTWRAPTADIRLERDRDGIRGYATLDLATEARETHVMVSGNFDAKTRKTDTEVRFEPINPAAFAKIEKNLLPLAAVDLPISGVVRLVIGADRAVESSSFELAGGEGHVDLPNPLDQLLAVRSLELKGTYAAAGHKIEIERLGVDFGPQGRIMMPGKSPHPMPLRSAELSGRFFGAEGRAEVTDIRLDLDGPTAQAALAVDGIGGAMTVSAEGTLRNVVAGEVKRIWPETWGPFAYRWVTANIASGTVPEAHAKAKLRVAEDGAITVDAVNGNMILSDITVDYLSPMPKATKANGTATFDMHRFDIVVQSGEVPGGVTVKGGTVSFTGLDAYDQFMNVDMKIDGPLRRAMELIDHEPLKFAKALAIDPRASGGRAEVDLKLSLLLELALTAEKVKVQATAKMTEAMLKGAVLGRDLTDGKLTLAVNNAGMDVKGTGKLGGIPADIHWRQNFKDGAPFISRYKVVAQVENAKNLFDAGVDIRPLPDGFVTGGFGAELDFVSYADRTSRLDVAADLTNAAFDMPKMGWAKARGVAGTAKASLKIANGVVTAIPTISIAAGDLSVEGHAAYAPDGSGLEKLELGQVRFGRNDLAVTVTQRAEDGGWNAAIRGASADVEPIWEDVIGSDKKSFGKDVSARLRLGIALSIDKVWLAPNRSLDAISGTFRHDGERWRTIKLKGLVGNRKPFDLDVRPVQDGNRTLAMRANDAGALLKALDFYDNMQGGVLEIVGTYHDNEPGQPLKGRVLVRDYRVIDAPVLARLLSVLALTGILDELRGDGLGFSQLDLPFTLRDGLLAIDNVKAFGPSLGFTATGKVYTDADMVDVQGTIVPAYAINSAFGHIPLLGSLFTGGEKGGGVFAATYNMTGQREDPKISVNPLTALAPGFLRNLFGIFGGKQGAEVPETEKNRPKAPN